MKPKYFTWGLLLCLLLAFPATTQAQTKKKSQLTIQHDVLGQGFDLRKVDALNWVKSSKGRKLLRGARNSQIIDQSWPTAHHFVTNTYEYEENVLQSDSVNRTYLAFNSDAFYKPLKSDHSGKLLLVYSVHKKAVGRASLSSQSAQTLDSAMVEDFRRLGRDITAEGFIHRYGTHYAREVVYGGVFIQRNAVSSNDFIYSPYKKDEFVQKVITEIQEQQNNLTDSDPYINAGRGDRFTVGGDANSTSPQSWASSVYQNIQPIEVRLESYADLFKNLPIDAVEEKGKKVQLLDSVIKGYTKEVKKDLAPPADSEFYKKYSLRFKQTVLSIEKKSMGRPSEDGQDYVGDIFFGGFSKDDAILKTAPLIEYGGIRLETLITDEKVPLSRNVTFTIKPEDLKRGYVSVWDDTKKLSKGNGRTRLQVAAQSGGAIVYKDALLQNIERTVEIETVDNDLFDVTYRLELLKDEGFLQNAIKNYNYTLDSELIAAANTGNKELLKSLFEENANTSAAGLLETIITNKQSNEILNLVLDYGVVPTTADLDLAFDPENYDATKVLILLERGAKPKNNMIYKAVAYKDAPAIYALFREGATPRNNDLAFAIEKYYYPTVKALMSEEYETFVAGKNELLLAVENDDEELAQQFIDLGSTSDAYILDQAAQFENQLLIDVVVPVTEANGETLEVVAKINDTELFDYFVKKDATLDNNKPAEIAIDNANTAILDLALKNGGEASKSLVYAIDKDNKPAIETSLENKAVADPVFAYATLKNDAQLFNDALTIYAGTPDIALKEAVQQDNIPFAQKVIDLKKDDINTSGVVQIAVTNDNIEMLSLLVDNDADPNQGMEEAIEKENVEITSFLIKKGAETVAPKLIQQAVLKENLALSKVLVEEGEADVNNAIVDASKTANVEITTYLLDQGATADTALVEAMETTDEDIILLLMDRTKVIEPDFLPTAARKGNTKVLEKLIERGLNPQNGMEDALRYKHSDALALLLSKGATASYNMLATAIDYEFVGGIAVLLDSGIDPSQAFKDGQHPLHLVCQRYDDKDVALIDMLVNAGAQIDGQNHQGETPLHIAVIGGEAHLPLIDHLLKKGADASLSDNKGKTALKYTDDRKVRSVLKKAMKR